jgi:hypothetical protein
MTCFAVVTLNCRIINLLHPQRRVRLNLGPVGFHLKLVLLPEHFENGGISKQVGELLPFTGLLPLPGEFVELARAHLLYREILGESAVRALFMAFTGQVSLADGLAQEVMR